MLIPILGSRGLEAILLQLVTNNDPVPSGFTESGLSGAITGPVLGGAGPSTVLSTEKLEHTAGSIESF